MVFYGRYIHGYSWGKATNKHQWGVPSCSCGPVATTLHYFQELCQLCLLIENMVKKDYQHPWIYVAIFLPSWMVKSLYFLGWTWPSPHSYCLNLDLHIISGRLQCPFTKSFIPSIPIIVWPQAPVISSLYVGPHPTFFCSHRHVSWPPKRISKCWFTRSCRYPHDIPLRMVGECWL